MSDQGTSGPSIFGYEFDAAAREADSRDAPADDLGWLTEDLSPESAGVSGSVPTSQELQQETAGVPASGEQQPQSQPRLPATEPAAQPTTEAPTPAPSDEAPSEETPKRWADRYESAEELEKGYKNIQALYSRTMQERQADRLRMQQMEAALQALQERATTQPGEPAPVLPEGLDDLTALTPQELQSFIDHQVEQRTQQVQGQVTEDLQRQQRVAAIQSSVAQFMATHPEVTPDSPLDYAIGQVIEEFQKGSDGVQRFENFPVDAVNLELAYELAQDESLRNAVVELDLVPSRDNLDLAKEAAANPALYREFKANPHLLDTDEGIEIAKQQAQLRSAIPAGQPVPGVVVNGQPSREQVVASAHVETGGTGAPIPGAPATPPRDEWDEVEALYASEKRDNVFGLVER